MYIKSYKCTRFAGLKDVNLNFEKGINVILGPNESGKSTIIEGIHSTLFKDIKLRRNNNLDKEFSFKFMPQPNGDFIDGKVTVACEDGDYEIHKEWGTSENIHLLTPSGNIIKNEKDVKEELAKILTYGEATYSNIVFAKQRDLKRALYNIVNDSEVTQEINDLLTRALIELDGISIDSIQKNIEDEIDTLYKRWDREKNYPENNRGINNPYKVGLGKILESYYNKENLKILMEEADKAEKEFEDICNRIKEIEDKVKTLNDKKLELEKIEDDVNNRMILDAEIASVNKELEDLMEANREWPRTEQLLVQLDEKIDLLKKKRENLNREKEDLEKVKNRDSLEKKLQRIGEIQAKLNSIITDLSTIPPITSDDIHKLTKIQTDLLTLETTMKAGKIFATLKRSTDKKVYVTRDFGDQEELELNTTVEANGLINISYGDEFEMEIKTGDLDFEELNEKYQEAKSEYQQFLESLSINTIEEAKLNLERIDRLENEKKSLGKQLELVLDNSTVEDLKEELKDLENVKTSRDLSEIEEELKQCNNEELNILAEKKHKSDLINQWTDKYTNHDNLLDLLIDKRAMLKEKTKKLEELQPLPEDFRTAEEFKRNLTFIKEELNKNQGTLQGLKEDYYEAKNNLLDTSYEELKREYLQAESIFERNIKRGDKLLEIQRVFIETKERFSSNPMEPLVQEFTRLLEIITHGRYKTGEIDEEFNIRIENLNGEIPVELLSAGTYDSVTLALRFSLLKHIFNDGGGYVVLDDCLVDLDPERKAQAVRLINDFAKDYQIIFTTCDPETANMLGGNIIEL